MSIELSTRDLLAWHARAILTARLHSAHQTTTRSVHRRVTDSGSSQFSVAWTRCTVPARYFTSGVPVTRVDLSEPGTNRSSRLTTVAAATFGRARTASYGAAEHPSGRLTTEAWAFVLWVRNGSFLAKNQRGLSVSQMLRPVKAQAFSQHTGGRAAGENSQRARLAWTTAQAGIHATSLEEEDGAQMPC